MEFILAVAGALLVVALPMAGIALIVIGIRMLLKGKG